MKGWLTIGQLATVAELSADTIRYYESVGLLPPPARSDAGYRLYAPTELRRLRLIKRAKLLGLSLPAIKDLVDQTFTGSCARLQQALLARIPAQLAEVERRLAELQALKQELLALQDELGELELIDITAVVAECPHCPVVEGTAASDRSANRAHLAQQAVQRKEPWHDPGKR
jgi:DNA-binding transcriptional MerR regulator